MTRRGKDKQRIQLTNSGVEFFDRDSFSGIDSDKQALLMVDQMYERARLAHQRGGLAATELHLPNGVDPRNCTIWIAAVLTREYSSDIAVVTLPVAITSDRATELACAQLHDAKRNTHLGAVLLQEGLSLFPDRTERTEQLYTTIRAIEVPSLTLIPGLPQSSAANG